MSRRQSGTRRKLISWLRFFGARKRSSVTRSAEELRTPAARSRGEAGDGAVPGRRDGRVSADPGRRDGRPSISAGFSAETWARTEGG